MVQLFLRMWLEGNVFFGHVSDKDGLGIHHPALGDLDLFHILTICIFWLCWETLSLRLLNSHVFCFGAGKRYLAWDQSCDGNVPYAEPMKIFQGLSQLQFCHNAPVACSRWRDVEGLTIALTHWKCYEHGACWMPQHCSMLSNHPSSWEERDHTSWWLKVWADFAPQLFFPDVTATVSNIRR